MKNQTIVLCDRDEKYLSNFVRYFMERQTIFKSVEAFSSLEHWEMYEQKEKVCAILYSESFFGVIDFTKEELTALHKELEECYQVPCIMLSEGEELWDIPAVYKYQPAEQVVKLVFSICSEWDRESFSSVKEERSRIIAVYSPEGGCLKTTAALTIGQLLAEKEKVLYLNLEKYAASYLIKSRVEDLADIFYFLETNQNNLFLKIQSMVQTIQRLDLLPAFLHTEDYEQVDLADWKRLLIELSEKSEYKTLILDFGSEFLQVSELLSLCETIYLPERETKAGNYKITEFYKRIEESGKTDCLEKIVSFKVPYFPELAKQIGEVETYTQTSFGEYMRETIAANDGQHTS